MREQIMALSAMRDGQKEAVREWWKSLSPDEQKQALKEVQDAINDLANLFEAALIRAAGSSLVRIFQPKNINRN